MAAALEGANFLQIDLLRAVVAKSSGVDVGIGGRSDHESVSVDDSIN